VSFYLSLSAVLIFDLFAGDPRWFPHPVRFIGLLCVFFERQTRKLAAIISLQWCGVLAFILVLGSVVGTTILSFSIILIYSPVGATLLAVALLYFCIATGDLISHSRVVYRSLASQDITTARKAVANLVGRDTEHLDETAIARGAVESVAENLVDGITAPLFWAFTAGLLAPLIPVEPIVGAAVGSVFYKAVNTMDSMYGYRNERYIYFGRWAARFDDLANYLPARISAFCVIVSAYSIGYDGNSSAKIYKRDRLQSPSPNSGHTESAFAGALGVQLGGESSYFGVSSIKPLIGRELKLPVASDIIRSNRLLLASTLTFFVLCVVCHFCFSIVFK
jgi:adenosylcobinamide-phosphate synthase